MWPPPPLARRRSSRANTTHPHPLAARAARTDTLGMTTHWTLRRALAALAVAAAAPQHARAQERAPEYRAADSSPIADSAQAARAAYREAAAAYRRGDLAAARASMRHAAEAWPGQQVYVYNAAALAARAADTADALRWLARYADLGAGRDLSADSSFRPIAGAPGYAALARRVRDNAAPWARSTLAFAVDDSTFHAEGIAFDPAGGGGGRWFLGSVRQRRIVAVDRDGRASDFVPAGGSTLAGVFGLAVDATRRTLWAATSALERMEGYTAADRGRAGVVAYDLGTGRLVRQLWLRPDSAEHVFGDLALAPNGDVYVSDSRTGVLYVARAGRDSLERFAAHPLLRSPQGMAFAADGRGMYVADYSHGLLRVDLATGGVRPVPAPDGATTLGIDGLYRRDARTLLGVQNGVTPPRVVALCLDPRGERVTRVLLLDRNLAAADEPTLGVLARDAFYYVATSAWEKYDDAGRRVPGTALRPVTVLRLPLDGALCG